MKRWINSLRGWLKRKRRLLTLAIVLLSIYGLSVNPVQANTAQQESVIKGNYSYNITLITQYNCGSNKEQYSFNTAAETNRWLDVYADEWEVTSHIEGNYILHKKALDQEYPCAQASLYSLLPDSLLSLFGDTFGPTHLIQSYFHFDTMMLESSIQANNLTLC